MTEETEWREAARGRGSVVFSLLLDTVIIVASLVCRWVVLAVLAHLFAPRDQQNFVVLWLERVSNYGIVAAATIFTTFDLVKIIVRSCKSLMRTVKANE